MSNSKFSCINLGLAKTIIFPLMLIVIDGCMTQQASREAARQAGDYLQPQNSEPMLMIFENNDETFLCKLGTKAQVKIETIAAKEPFRFKKPATFGEVSKDSFSLRTARELKKSPPANVEPCSLDWEEWFIKSIANGTPAPMDIASMQIPHLSEIKVGISGMGLLAGLCGRPIEATVLSVCSIGLNYAQDKGLIRPAN